MADTFEVIEDPDPPLLDPKVTLEPATLNQVQAYNDGWTITATGYIPGDYVALTMIYPTGLVMQTRSFYVNTDGGFTAKLKMPDPSLLPATTSSSSPDASPARPASRCRSPRPSRPPTAR